MRKIIIAVVLVAAIGLVLWSIAVTQRKSDPILVAAIEEYKKGNYEVAIQNYNKAIELHPDDAVAYNNRGLAYAALREFKKALADYDEAIELKLDYAQAHFNRGLAYFNLAPLGWGDRKMVQKGTADLTKAIQLTPGYVDAYYNRGLGYNQLYHYYLKPFSEEMIDIHELAVDDFDKVLELDPDYVLAHAGLGNAYYRYGEWDKATEYYSKALEHEDLILEKVGEKGLKAVYYSRARNYHQFERTHPAAISNYEKVLEFDPLCFDALSQLTSVLTADRYYERGVELSSEVIRLDGEGSFEAEEGLFAIGEGSFAAVENFFGGGPDLLRSIRAKCYMGLGKYDKALPDFEATMDAMSSGESYLNLGSCYLKMGETEKAKETLKEGIGFIDGQIAMGELFAGLGGGMPMLYMQHMERGLCHLRLGEYDEAIDDFLKVREHNPPFNMYGKNYDVEAIKNLGITYLEMGDAKKARSCFEEALQKAELPEIGAAEAAKVIRELLRDLK